MARSIVSKFSIITVSALIDLRFRLNAHGYDACIYRVNWSASTRSTSCWDIPLLISSTPLHTMCLQNKKNISATISPACCGLLGLAWGDQVCWPGLCSSSQSRVDRGSEKCHPWSSERKHAWLHDQGDSHTLLKINRRKAWADTVLYVCFMEETYTHSLSQMLFCQKKYPQ